MTTDRTSSAGDNPALDVADILTRALRLAADPDRSEASDLSVAEGESLSELAEKARRAGVAFDRFLSRAALEAARVIRGTASRAARDALEFLQADKRTAAVLVFTNDPEVEWGMTAGVAFRALANANRTIELIEDLSIGNDCPIFPLLGLRNLSSFVGEIYAREIQKLQKDRLHPNPNQDGYPDLLALTPEGEKYVAERERKGETSDKRFWSPYPYGGVEVKATCGETVPARVKPKPRIGESRHPLLDRLNWKAHHRDTNNLLGIYWDFIDGLPTVLGVFFRNDLTVDDWGKIVKPKEGGGRTTSVSILKNRGVKKMGQGWLVLPKRNDLRKPLCQQKVFAIRDATIAQACSGWDSSLTETSPDPRPITKA